MGNDMAITNQRIRLYDAVGGDPDVAQAVWEIIGPALAERDDWQAAARGWEERAERVTAERDAAVKRRDQAENRASLYRQQVAGFKAERDALKAAIEALSARHQPKTAMRTIRCQKHGRPWNVSRAEIRDCPDCQEEPVTVCSNLTCCEWLCADRRAIDAALDAPETPESDDWLKQLADASLAAAREKFGPTFAPETPGDA